MSEEEKVDEKWELIENLDLSTVNERFSKKKSFIWKLTHDANKIEAEYRQFLYLAATHPEDVIVPWSDALDEFWHTHILDTRKYEQDCMVIFGKMFHHDPHLPIGSKAQVDNFNNTKKLYRETFGAKARNQFSDEAGCGGAFIPVFCSSCAGVVGFVEQSFTPIDVSSSASSTVDNGAVADSGISAGVTDAVSGGVSGAVADTATSDSGSSGSSCGGSSSSDSGSSSSDSGSSGSSCSGSSGSSCGGGGSSCGGGGGGD